MRAIALATATTLVLTLAPAILASPAHAADLPDQLYASAAAQVKPGLALNKPAPVGRGAVTPMSVGETPPDRISQDTSLAGFSLDATTPAHTLSMSFVAPSMTCGGGSTSFPFPWQSGMSGTEAELGLGSGAAEIQMFFNCNGGFSKYGGVIATMDDKCAGLGGSNPQCPLEKLDKTVTAGDLIDMTVTSTATGTGSASVFDENTGSSLSYAGQIMNFPSPQLNFLEEDYCDFARSAVPCVNTLAGGNASTTPPLWNVYSPLVISGATVDGSDLQSALNAPDISAWGRLASVYGAWLFDEPSTLSGGNFTITNSNRPLPVMNVSGGKGVNVTSTPQTITFTVTLSASSTDRIYADYTTISGSAVDGVNFDGSSGLLTFPPGTTTQTIPITVEPGPANGGSITFALGVSNPSYAVAGDLGIGTIYEGPYVSSVTPDSAPTDGAVSMTINGFDFGDPGSRDTVTFCNAAGYYPTTNCVSGLNAVVDSDNVITVTSPDASPLIAGKTSFTKADTVVRNAKGVASDINTGDLVEFGCTQVVRALGDYQYSACVTDTSDPNTEVTEQDSDVDGLNVSASSKDQVDYSSNSGGTLTSTGPVTVSLTIAGTQVTLQKGLVSQPLHGPMLYTPSATTIGGFKLTGPMTITPGAGGVSTGSVAVVAPDWLGKPTGTMTFRTKLNSGSVTGIQVQLPKGVFGNFLSLGATTLSYTGGTWSINSMVSAGGSSTGTVPLSGSFTASGSTLNGGSLVIAQAFPLFGMLVLGGLALNYTPGSGWIGTGGAVGGSSFAGVTFSFASDTTGKITGGTITASTGLLLGELAVASVTLSLTGNAWTVSTQLPAGDTAASTITTSLTVTGGVITAGSVNAAKIDLGNGFKISGKFTYALTNGASVWTATVKLALPEMLIKAGGGSVTGIDVGMIVINGVPSEADVTFKGSIPMVDGFFLTQFGVGIQWNPQLFLSKATIGGSFGPDIAGQRLVTITGTYTRSVPPAVAVGNQILSGDISVLSTKLGTGALQINDDGTDSVSLTLGEGGTIGLAVGKLNIIGSLTGTFANNTVTLSGNATINFVNQPVFSGTVLANAKGMAACNSSDAGFTWLWKGSPHWVSSGCSTVSF